MVYYDLAITLQVSNKEWKRIDRLSYILLNYFPFQPIKKQRFSGADDRTFSRTCKLPGQNQRFKVRGQRRQNVSSRTSPLPATF